MLRRKRPVACSCSVTPEISHSSIRDRDSAAKGAISMIRKTVQRKLGLRSSDRVIDAAASVCKGQQDAVFFALHRWREHIMTVPS